LRPIAVAHLVLLVAACGSPTAGADAGAPDADRWCRGVSPAVACGDVEYCYVRAAGVVAGVDAALGFDGGGGEFLTVGSAR
jgi:hypothetical protein